MQAGFFELRTPKDLLRKLEHDLARLEKTPLNVYVAFDFFVTAEHMLDWLFPGKTGKPQRDDWRNKNTILAVCSHIANGAKHFSIENPHHVSVEKTSAAYAAFQSTVFQSSVFQTTSMLIIKLDGKAAEEFGERISPLELAQKIFMFWSEHLFIPHTSSARG